MFVLQSSKINDAITMFAIEIEMSEKSTTKINYADFERLVRSMRNLSLTIDQIASYIKNYENSTKKLLDLYQSEKIMKMIEKHDKNSREIVDWLKLNFSRWRTIYLVTKRNRW